MAAEQPRSFAEKLNHLFKTIKRPNGRKHTNAEVAAAAGCTREYISALRHGKRPPPTGNIISAIAEFFSVPPSYFFSDEMSEKINTQMDLILALAALKDSDARIAALRTIADVAPEELPKVTRAIQQALTDSDPGSDAPPRARTDRGDP